MSLISAKHAPVNEFQSFQAIWRSIPEQLAKENTKFIFSHVKKGWRAKTRDALEWLIGPNLFTSPANQTFHTALFVCGGYCIQAVYGGCRFFEKLCHTISF